MSQGLDFEGMLEAWRVNNVVNLELLDLCRDEDFDLKPGKGKTIRSNFVHIIGNRGYRVEEKVHADKDKVPKLDWKTATREEIREGLVVTELLMVEVLRKRMEKPDRFGPILFLSYMVAHEAHHRSQIEIAFRINGAEPEEMLLYELWNWPKKSRDD